MMTPAELWECIKAAGIALTAEGDAIRAEPRQALTDAIRDGIKANRAAVLAMIEAEGELYTEADLAEFDRLIREDCARQGIDPAPLLAMRRSMAPARVMAELRWFRAREAAQ